MRVCSSQVVASVQRARASRVLSTVSRAQQVLDPSQLRGLHRVAHPRPVMNSVKDQLQQLWGCWSFSPREHRPPTKCCCWKSFKRAAFLRILFRLGKSGNLMTKKKKCHKVKLFLFLYIKANHVHCKTFEGPREDRTLVWDVLHVVWPYPPGLSSRHECGYYLIKV